MDKTIFKPIHTKVNYSDDCIEVIKKDKAAPDENTYLRNTLYDFHNGTIEVDVLSKLTKDAPDLSASSFVLTQMIVNLSHSIFVLLMA